MRAVAPAGGSSPAAVSGVAGWPGSAQNSQNVVLLRRDAVGLDHSRETPLYGVCGLQQAQSCLLLR